RDSNIRVVRVVVCENPYARVPLTRDVFIGPGTERHRPGAPRGSPSRDDGAESTDGSVGAGWRPPVAPGRDSSARGPPARADDRARDDRQPCGPRAAECRCRITGAPSPGATLAGRVDRGDRRSAADAPDVDEDPHGLHTES